MEHFVSRYLKAQEKGWAGITEDKSCAKEEIKHPVYTFGVNFLGPEKKVKTKCQSRYNHKMKCVCQQGGKTLSKMAKL